MVESLAEARFRLTDLSPSVQMEDISSFSRTPISVKVSGLSHFVSAMGTVSSIEHGDGGVITVGLSVVMYKC